MRTATGIITDTIYLQSEKKPCFEVECRDVVVGCGGDGALADVVKDANLEVVAPEGGDVDICCLGYRETE